MLKGKCLYGCLVAVSILSVPLMADAKIVSNGVSLNGTVLNTNQMSHAATNGTVRVEGGQLVMQTTSIAR